MISIPTVIDTMTGLGFKGIKAIEASISPFIPNCISTPILVTGLNGASNFSVFPLDATSAPEFNDFIYVSIEDETYNLLEAACISKAPPIYDDPAMTLLLREKFPGQSFVIKPGYFWEPCYELRSYLSVVRQFTLEGKEMFLLPNGSIVEKLSKMDIGGA
jgi:hypothetical protein